MIFDISSMLNPEVYDHPVEHLELIETHISWIVLTGSFAYKIKKPVNFGFLDFSTLENRHTFCEQELRLNSRLAPAIYLDVVSISNLKDKLVISDEGVVIEYAVKMNEFPQSAQLDHMLAAGRLSVELIDPIARMIADFHRTIKIADDSMDYGNLDAINQPVEENFTQINEHLGAASYQEKLGKLQQWTQSEFQNRKKVFIKRKQDGFIRECHGDMHLRNLIWLNNKPMAFDCIEFNPSLRWIDVISDVAFLIMDLQDRKQNLLANHFLNTYLELTGDYAGLTILPYYLCYRALVRAKVDALYLENKNIQQEEREAAHAEFTSYLELASTYIHRSQPTLIIMRGVSASGKSTISEALLAKSGAIRIRSDVERKRLFNISSTGSGSADIETGIYTKEASQTTYEKLLELSGKIIDAGFSVIIDAAFLNKEQRDPFQELASSLSTAYVIIEITAPAEVLRQRIVARKKDISDADLSVLEHQLKNWQPLHKDELDFVVSVDTTQSLDIEELIKTIESHTK